MAGVFILNPVGPSLIRAFFFSLLPSLIPLDNEFP